MSSSRSFRAGRFAGRIAGCTAAQIVIVLSSHVVRAALIAATVALVAIALLVFAVKWGPEWLADDLMNEKLEHEEEGRIRTAILAVLAGLLAALGAYYTARTFALNRAGQITERFTRAIDQLGNAEAIDVRLGGIYALERIARDSKDDHPQVMEVLTAYVRQHAPLQSDTKTAAGENPPPRTMQPLAILRQGFEPAAPGGDRRDAEPADEPPPSRPGPPLRLRVDIQAAMSVLARRNVAYDRAFLDLSGTDLRDLVVAGVGRGRKRQEAALAYASFSGADLQNALLSRANVRGAWFVHADLRRARLMKAELTGANFTEADLRLANLAGANLRDANLAGAILQGARYSADTSPASVREVLRAGRAILIEPE